MAVDALLSARELELLRFQAGRLGGLRARGSSPLSGPQTAWQRGAGLELEDLRPYQLGDDVRHIAWRASARSGRPISKVFRAERRQRILVLVEQHPGMAFATRGELKAAVAARACALIGFAALRQGAEIGGMVAGRETEFFQPGTHLDRALALIGAANRAPGHDYPAVDAAEALAQLHQLARRQDSLYLISDFQHWDDALLASLKQLTERHLVCALQIVDAGEQTLTAVGRLHIRSPFDGRELVIDTDDAELRRQYAAAMNEHQQQLEQLFKRSGMHHQQLFTDRDPLPTLARAL
ncbi:hypothetical protein Tel_16585 [Candidatus Tenderia electrophaga]|jgi:uncharacterized protein (DUF58 family)|uniref:DUF58 domain-containing protein n=1 Tax=Candidatus Tenderia electrophaga TaxID=1748243 RepID=A0A0S2THX2_9GAMM|nr:hypothetical protein Tel_16585 [Candidatus Tenderia electrophaga]